MLGQSSLGSAPLGGSRQTATATVLSIGTVAVAVAIGSFTVALGAVALSVEPTPKSVAVGSFSVSPGAVVVTVGPRTIPSAIGRFTLSNVSVQDLALDPTIVAGRFGAYALADQPPSLPPSSGIQSDDPVNGCVVLPHLCDWRRELSLEREWSTLIGKGVTGAEDRATGRTDALRALNYSILSLSAQDRARCVDRLRQALKTSRACVPLWTRPQYLGGQVSAPLGREPIHDVGWSITGVQSGRTYFYQRGAKDDSLQCAPGIELLGTGYFVATSATCQIVTSSTVLSEVGTVREVLHGRIPTDGLWPWAAGDYAFFLRMPEYGSVWSHENKSYLINCQGYATGNWFADVFYQGGGLVQTSNSIDTSAVVGFPAPPQAVLQKSRASSDVSQDEGEIRYEFSTLQPGIECRIRLHFVESQAGFDGTEHRRIMDVIVEAATRVMETRFEPYRAAGNALDKDVALDFVMAPDAAGKLRVRLRAADIRTVRLVATSNVDVGFIVFSLDGVNLVGGDWVLLTAQTDPTQNGLWSLNNPTHVHKQMDPGEVFRVLEGDTWAGTFWRNTSVEAIAPEDAVELNRTSTPYHALITAIELHQFTWEVVQLQSGSNANALVLQNWLKGHYAANRAVYPALFGKPSVRSVKALTDHHAEIELKVAEPLPSGNLGESTCLAMDLTTPTLFPYPVSLLPGEGEPTMPGWCNVAYWPGPSVIRPSDGSGRPIGQGDYHGMDGQDIDAWVALSLQQFAAEHPTGASNPTPFFRENTSGTGLYWQATSYFGNDSFVTTSGNPIWEVHIAYCAT